MVQVRHITRGLVAIVAFVSPVWPAAQTGHAQDSPLSKPPATPGAVGDQKMSHGVDRHPLDPLDPEEIRLAVATLRESHKLPESYRFVTVTLDEPAKSLVLHARAARDIAREARIILLDKASGTGYEAVVNLTTRSVARYEVLPKGVQPPIMMDEFGECEEAAEVAGISRRPQEARNRGPEPRDDRRLVGRSLRQRARRRPGQAARPRIELGSLKRDGQWLCPPYRRGRHGDRPQQQGGGAGRGLRGRARAANGRAVGP